MSAGRLGTAPPRGADDNDKEMGVLKLYGFCISNYYNKVKLALLEKGVPFEEVYVRPSQDEDVLCHSPLGKVPYLVTSDGALSESHPMIEYIEDAYPDVPLLPADPFARAKCRELIQYLELHVELVARRLYPQAYFGVPANAALNAEVKPLLERNLARLARLIRFEPYVGGTTFTQADCSAWVHLPLVGRATQQVYGEDMVATALGGDRVKQYLALIGERPHAQRVADDRKREIKAAAPKG